MRKIVLASLAVGAVAAVGLAPETARARDYPFCIKGEEYMTPVGDCSFDTYEQCKATASGRRAYCDVNPYYDYRQARVAPPRHPYPYRAY
jgi:hypothetical protein